MSYEGWEGTGTVYNDIDGTPYIRREDSADPFAWLGDCARLDEGTANLGEMTVTKKRNPRGGVMPHGIIPGSPDTATINLVFKRLQFDRKKSDLLSCFWTLDDRVTCGGREADYWNKWTEITRYCKGMANGRTMPASNWGAETPAEQIISVAMTYLLTEDLYRVSGEVGSISALAGEVLDVAAIAPARCPDVCNSQEDCVVVAVTEDIGGNAFLYVNRYGGDLAQWEAALTLTGFGANDASRVTGAGDFVCVISTPAAELCYTNDILVAAPTWVENVTTTAMTAHAPASIDMIDQSLVVIGGADGYVFGSYDGAATWSTLADGDTTVNVLDNIKIARDAPNVIYATSTAADTVIKSVNGGRTWIACALTTAAAIHSLLVINQNRVLVGSAAGQLFETLDGGDTWTEQMELPGLGTKANVTIADLTMCGCGDLGLVTNNATDDQFYFYRNVDAGASGRWFKPENMEAVAAGKLLNALTCCGSSHFIAAGGEAATDNQCLLLR